MRESNNKLSEDIYNLVSSRIAYYIAATENNLISIEELISKMKEDGAIKSSNDIPWLVLQVKNELLKNSLLFVSFEKPLLQKIGLSLKGKRFFHFD